MKNELPFGGKTILLGGDFRQVLPVLPKQGRSEVVNAMLPCSPLWSLVRVFRLIINERVRRCRDSPDFKDFADFVKIGDGSLNDGEDFVEVPAQFIHNGSVEELLEFTQPRLREGDFDAESAVLTPTNASAEKFNSLALDMLGGNSITLYSTDYLHDDLDGSR